MKIRFIILAAVLTIALAGCSDDSSPSSPASTAAPSIASVRPTAGSAGARVVILGANFSPTPGENEVMFNGVVAIVDSATATRIVTSVPSGASTGPIKVTVGTTAAVGQNFTVTTAYWSTAVPMREARALHTATLLDDGRVLVAGGENGGAALSTCEIFDPSSGTWSATGNLPEPVSRHRAVKLRDGRVLIVSSYQRSLTSIYDPTTGMWQTTGNTTVPRLEPGLTLLPDGRVLASGGYRLFASPGPLSSCETYDPATETWTATASFSTERVGHFQFLLGDSSVLACLGGPATSEVYDLSTSRWRAAASTPASALQALAGQLPDQTALITGGTTVSGHMSGATWVYRAQSRTWASLGQLNVPRRNGGLAPVPSHARLLAVGGYGTNSDNSPLSSCELFDPATGRWTTTASLSVGRAFHQATTLHSGEILVTGGFMIYPNATASVEIFTP